eukprot:Polyplicarium_translucidae@DN1950_c0_g1_i1.p1
MRPQRAKNPQSVEFVKHTIQTRTQMCDAEDPEYVPLKARRAQIQRRAVENLRKRRKATEELDEVPEEEEICPAITEAASSESARLRKKTLLEQSTKLRKEAEANKARTADQEVETVRQEEQRILEQLQRSMDAPLLSVRERAKGIVYTERITTSWEIPAKYASMPQAQIDELRDRYVIDINGEDTPPPISSFRDMRLPPAVLKGLGKKGIAVPTQIQMQGIPAVLQGRDLIGIAFTGSGKTLVFGLPMILFALESELLAKYTNGEGPHGLVLCPSRELATQTSGTIEFFLDQLKAAGYPEMRSVCLIGGVAVSEQASVIRRGVHIAVATPGRLQHLLNDHLMHLRQCRFLAIDEADKLVNEAEEEVRFVLDHFYRQRQTVLFSATMPPKIQDFAKSALVDPIVVNVGRAGAANLDVVQEVEYVKQEMKLRYLLKCFEKTPPPVLVFCDSKKDVDDIYEYLLLKGVEVAAIHGGLGQDERSEAIRAFREGRKDVLVGTDVASKGLDFPAIQHVINYDMPKEVENYVHRIGRTGRCGRTGVATTFINKNQDETVLLDLKALLVEAGQKVPPFLEALDTTSATGGTLLALKDIGGVRGCSYCGGLGHRIGTCPKLETKRHQQLTGSSKDFLTSGSRYGGTQGYGGDW